VKSAMTGGSVPIVGINSVGSENIKNESVTTGKLTITKDDSVYETNIWEIGSIVHGDGSLGDLTTRVRSSFIKSSIGTTIKSTSNIKFITELYDENFNYINGYNYNEELLINEDFSYLRIVLKYDDEREITDIPDAVSKMVLYNSSIPNLAGNSVGSENIKNESVTSEKRTS